MLLRAHERDQYLFLGNRARYQFVVLDYHSCSISKRRLIIELDNYKSSSIANRVRGPHLVSGQPSSIHVHRTRIAIRVPFQINLG